MALDWDWDWDLGLALALFHRESVDKYELVHVHDVA
jgi:hypothetical protein